MKKKQPAEPLTVTGEAIDELKRSRIPAERMPPTQSPIVGGCKTCLQPITRDGHGHAEWCNAMMPHQGR